MRLATFFIVSGALALSVACKSVDPVADVGEYLPELDKGKGASARIVDVDLIKKNVESLHGKVLVVEGWLGECEGLICSIYPTRDSTLGPYKHSVPIGFDEKFDRLAKPLQYRRVILTAQVDKTCSTGKVICLDRAGTLRPIDIVAWGASPPMLRKN